ncbi:MAG TPA: zf-HC2 domain-containing protein [Vicinamibacterales bacterium]|jgi:anti-sigma factor RsiW
MSNCQVIDPLVTPYVDGQLSETDRALVEQHIRACPPCHSRVTAECTVQQLMSRRKTDLQACCAPKTLHTACSAFAHDVPQMSTVPAPDAPRAGARVVPMWPTAPAAPASWRARMVPMTLAASLAVLVGGAFLYQLTTASSHVMAAELAADHIKCFALNGVLHTHDTSAAVESSMWSGFGWRMHLPQNAAAAGLELVGSRPCMYANGKIAHIMYRRNGEPVSLFMLPGETRTNEVVDVLGQKAAIWCDRDRTYVLVAREPLEDVERMVSLVRTSLR